MAKINTEHQLALLAEELAHCKAILAARSRRLLEQSPVRRLVQLPADAVVACPGVPGAFTHTACERFFPKGDIRFYRRFSEVAQAVRDGSADFGVLPVENSSAGQVNEALELLGKTGLYICADTALRIEHCLCAHPDTDPAAIGTVLSHPQALLQCAHALEERGLATESFSNTAAAAKAVGSGERRDCGCVCSQRSAVLYGLRVLERNLQDAAENYTRFLCFSRENILLPGADTISLALSLPNRPGALNRLLTRFAAFCLDLRRLRSLPVASRDFLVRFHLDFTGSIEDDAVCSLLGALCSDLDDFVFLGNYITLEG